MELPDKFKSRDLEAVVKEHELCGYVVVRRYREVAFAMTNDNVDRRRIYKKKGKHYIGGQILEPLRAPKGDIFYMDVKWRVKT